MRAVLRGAFIVGSAALPLVAQTRAPATAAPDAASLYRRGDYARAIELAGQGSLTPMTASVLVRALTDVGRAAEAVTRTDALSANPEVSAARARALETLGRLDAADAAWVAATRGRDSLYARVALLRLRHERGAGDSVFAELGRLVARTESRNTARTASDLHAMAVATRLLGHTDPQRFKESLRYFDAALGRDANRIEAHTELGELFLEKFNFADARTTLAEVLSVNPRQPRALAAMARIQALDGRNGAPDPLPLLLTVNPNSPEAHLAFARRLIDAEQYGAAEEEARKGLVTDSAAPGPWVMIAAARWLANDTAGHRSALERAHRRLPGSAAAEIELAELSARNRLYADAVRFAQAGVSRDARDARVQALLGINLLRIGDVAAGRGTLERAFALDPFDVWAKNTLDLLDSYAKARTVRTEHFDLVIEEKDADLISLYAAPLAEEAWSALTTRYAFQPSGRVRMEFFRSHADFSVRAVGLAGLGALGVAFGNVLAIDAPPARPRGEFNWAAVTWHEFTHTITLGKTNNRVPRWVSEGLSVHEERRAKPDWGGGVTPQLIAAYSAGRLQPVSRLNDGFVHPRYEQEVILSYALSAYVFEMLEGLKGIDGIRALLDGYRVGGKTPALMQTIYGLTPPALDSTFDAWFRTKFAREFTAVRGESVASADSTTRTTELAGPLKDALAAAAAAVQQKQWYRVAQAARRAVSLFPAYVDPGSGYHFLITANTELRDSDAVAEALSAIVARNGEAVTESVTLAALREAIGDTTGAVAALAKATLIDPYDATSQARLADLAFAKQDWPTAIRARRAVLALVPSDRADAFYRLAQVLAASGDTTSARREVLRALDLAPNFEAAQDLLLSIRSSGNRP